MRSCARAKAVRRRFTARRVSIIAEPRLAPDNPARMRTSASSGGPRQFFAGAAAAAAGAAAAEAAAAGEAPGEGEAPGDGDGAAGLGSGALDCVKTINVTVRSGVAFCWMSVGAVRRKPKLRVSPGTNGSTGRPKLVNSSGVATGM